MTMPTTPSLSRLDGPADTVELSWLVTVRWTGVAALAGALAGGSNLTESTHIGSSAWIVAISLASNVWLALRIRRRPAPDPTIGGWLVAGDVVVLSWVLRTAGGVLNPASIFYLVHIVLAALVLGRGWAWVITLLSVGGYGILFLAPPSELAAAGAMHPEVGLHVRGMWIAFAATALLVAILVSRLASMVERRDRALEALRERSTRDARLASLATLSAGAAHELSTPLGTIAVAARELEHSLGRSSSAEVLDDVRLIRDEVDRCRRILDDMSARVSEPAGEMALRTTVASIARSAVAALGSDDRDRVDLDVPEDLSVAWPSGVVVRMLVNLIRNGLQASTGLSRVQIRVQPVSDGRVQLQVVDAGSGMSPSVRARVGEPFFTTKAAGSGMGLGLFVTQSAVDQLGGSLSIESQEGRGTTVTILLPRELAA